MRKFLISFLSLAFIVCLTFGLTACGNKKEELPDLADCEIGYQLPVYPGVEFDYKVVDRNANAFIVHISEIKLTLAKKNTITANTTLEKPFYRYELTFTAKGSTDTKLAGEHMYLGYLTSTNASNNTAVTTVDDFGNITWEKSIGVNEYVVFSFTDLAID